MEMNKTVYFGGTFRGYNLKELDVERQEVTFLLRQAGFKVIDPLRGKAFNNTALEIANKFNPNEIVHRDLADVLSSDIIFLLMTKPSIGSACEIMYGSVHNKTIVVISDNPEVIMHPWVRSLSTKILPTVEEGIDYLISFLG